MNKIIIGLVAVMAVLLVYQSVQIWSLQPSLTGAVVTAAVTNTGIDMSGWTENEKMMYEHHGTLPARLQGNVQQASTMVGGC